MPKCKCCGENDIDYESTGLCEPCDEAEFYASGGKREDMSEFRDFNRSNDFGSI